MLPGERDLHGHRVERDLQRRERGLHGHRSERDLHEAVVGLGGGARGGRSRHAGPGAACGKHRCDLVSANQARLQVPQLFQGRSSPKSFAYPN